MYHISRTYLVVCFLVFVIAIINILLMHTIRAYLHQERQIDYEYVGECETIDDIIGDYIWVPVRDKQYDFEYSDIRKHYNTKDIDFDFVNYKYICVQNYKIADITVNYIDVWGKFSRSPFFHPRVLLYEGEKNILYIYKVDAKISFRNDIHSHEGFGYRTILVDPPILSN